MKHNIRGLGAACAVLGLSLPGPELLAQAAEIPYSIPPGYVLRTDTGIVMMLRLLKANGEPLAKGVVSVLRVNGKDVNSGGGLVHPAKREPFFPDTNEDGVYWGIRVKSGRYSVYVRSPGEGVAVVPDVKIDEANPQPITVRLQPEGSLRIKAHHVGQEAGLGGARLMLVPFDADSLVDEDKRDDPNSLLWLLPVDDAHRVTRDGDGTLDLSGLRAGQYWATIVLPGYRIASPSQIQTVKIEAGQVTDLDVAMEPEAGAPLTLLILGSNGVPQVRKDQQILLQPAPEPAVRTQLPSRVATAILSSTQRSRNEGDIYRRARTDGSGHLTLNPIPPGRWRVLLYGQVMKGTEIEVGAAGGEGVVQPENPVRADFDEVEAAAIVEK